MKIKPHNRDYLSIATTRTYTHLFNKIRQKENLTSHQLLVKLIDKWNGKVEPKPKKLTLLQKINQWLKQ